MRDRMDSFVQLERLNAQIDIWIDEEDYCKVRKALPIADEELKAKANSCLCHPHCTHGEDRDLEWRSILARKRSRPIPYACHQDLTGGKVRLNRHWSRLFYAKLLRARIQQKGTDCYLHRLDEVVAYLEKHLPTISVGDTAKLAVLYLLELSAASQSFEILAFADRACRIMNARSDMFVGEEGKNFRWFYDLLARYNMGIGYFHKGRYRKAIMEFNYIIEQVKEAKEADKKTQLDFFDYRHGYAVLYLPAVLYRADVQLRLQLAYHAIDTLDKYLKPPEKIGTYKEVRAQLIKAEAYQQMGRLDDEGSWEYLRRAYCLLFSSSEPPNEPEKQRAQNKAPNNLKKRTAFELLPCTLFNEPWKNIKGQFLHFYVEDYLEWLKQTSLATKQQDRCSKMLCYLFSPKYFKLVQFHSRSRNGYYQQLAKFLAWLARAGAPSLENMAKSLYFNRGVEMLKKPNDAKCALCENRGADLKSMNSQYYTWFKDSILEFFKDCQKLPNCNNEKAELKKFVKRFIKEEQEREDLRINDLNLRYNRYNSDVVKDELTGGFGLCRGDTQLNQCRMKSAFGNLLYRPGEKFDSEALNSEDYRRTMDLWNTEFRSRLESKSMHSGHRAGLYLVGLQRWNSSSPAQGRSVGGGYLLYHTDKDGTVDLGIAIDPGFDFVRNLFHMGFSISDIDIVLISHSHVDHVRDFESIIQLLTDLKKKSKSKRNRCLHVILSLGVYERLKHIIEDPFYRYHVEPYIIDAHREIEPGYFEKLKSGEPFRFAKLCKTDRRRPSGAMRYEAIVPDSKDTPAAERENARIEVKVKPTRAYHQDPSHYSDSFGFLVEVTEYIKPPEGSSDAPYHTVTLGYTGDTKWVYPGVHDPLKRADRLVTDVAEQYAGCNAVIVHLGSLVDTDDEEGLSKPFMDCLHCDKEQQGDCRDLVCEQDHPYLVGMLRMLSTLRSKAKDGDPKQLVLVSEFGEELRGGIRTDLVKRLTLAYGDALDFLPVDVGMDVQLLHCEKREDSRNIDLTMRKVWCVQCERFVDIGDAQFERYGVDEALFCVCRTCRKATPLNVMQDKLRQLYEVGRELRTLDKRMRCH